MKLVPDWQEAYTWISTWCFTISAAVNATWLAVPSEMQDSIPPEWITAATVLLMICGTLGRLIDQKAAE